MLTCTKRYDEIPIAHRQHRHDGHCALIHGHNWSFILTFACEETDENGFVVDFGRLGYIRDWFNENLDHACMIASDDPALSFLRERMPAGTIKIAEVPNPSCEGLAQYLFGVFDGMIRMRTKSRVWLHALAVEEDRRNYVQYQP